MVSGFIGPSMGWRSPFLVISVPALFLSVLIWVLAKEPLRGGKEKEVLKVKNDLMDSSVEDNNYLEKFEYHKVILIIIITFD
jgi:predicted MFS family arabinose efflux permease